MSKQQGQPGPASDLTKERYFANPVEIVRAIDDSRWASRPALRRFATFAVEHPFEMAFEPVSRLSLKMGIAPSSMVRCARELGFSGYREMRQWYIDYLRAKRRIEPGFNSAVSRRDQPA